MSADLVEGEEYVLLLTAFEDGRHVLVDTTQGYYEVEGSSAVAREGDEVALSAESLAALDLTG
ncbi:MULTISPECIES: hypothetical protein [Actinoalloteichus]|uniref:Uncharacterized protein n=1 Tax=Actinoalloteichus fjordicus TaxID=1612552 RepID=A0AAC9PQM4_9PSEU|nr:MULTISPECIES: hypothetical protein [Actinoalloteichus]APU13250.1 hypothetical protein UA74_05880 [Actinoalloteichus fjordicus]APU19201.1 hypothetical protein UA75_05885 [Actinoalloteichus sp. GBA129-24]